MTPCSYCHSGCIIEGGPLAHARVQHIHAMETLGIMILLRYIHCTNSAVTDTAIDHLWSFGYYEGAPCSVQHSQTQRRAWRPLLKTVQ